MAAVPQVRITKADLSRYNIWLLIPALATVFQWAHIFLIFSITQESASFVRLMSIQNWELIVKTMANFPNSFYIINQLNKQCRNHYEFSVKWVAFTAMDATIFCDLTRPCLHAPPWVGRSTSGGAGWLDPAWQQYHMSEFSMTLHLNPLLSVHANSPVILAVHTFFLLPSRPGLVSLGNDVGHYSYGFAAPSLSTTVAFTHSRVFDNTMAQSVIFVYFFHVFALCWLCNHLTKYS